MVVQFLPKQVQATGSHPEAAVEFSAQVAQQFSVLVSEEPVDQVFRTPSLVKFSFMQPVVRPRDVRVAGLQQKEPQLQQPMPAVIQVPAVAVAVAVAVAAVGAPILRSNLAATAALGLLQLASSLRPVPLFQPST